MIPYLVVVRRAGAPVSFHRIEAENPLAAVKECRSVAGPWDDGDVAFVVPMLGTHWFRIEDGIETPTPRQEVF